MADIALQAVELCKTFRIPHEQRTTLKEYFLHPLRRVAYERNQALDRVSFEVEAGEFFGVIGPNGSGKSTLLKTIAGIYRGDSGIVEVNGRLSPFIELGVGFSFELNARDNIRINGTLLGFSQRELNEKTEEILDFSGLERFVDQKLKNYSSGMLLRLAYSIAIQVPFDILLLDEVLAVGDANFQEKCFATFDRFRQEGKTVVLVSHDLLTVERFCTRALLLQNGKAIALGSADEVVAQYRRGGRPLQRAGRDKFDEADPLPTGRRVEWITRDEALDGWFIRSKLEPAAAVVDIGPGIYPQTLLTPDVHVCVEPFKPYLDRLRDKVHGDPRYIFLNATWDEALAAFIDESVDTVFALDVIEHLDKAEGKRLIAEAQRVARRQVVVFTPLGFYPQSYEPGERDRWGMLGGEWQTHRSGWQPDDFDEGWRVIACKDFHHVDENNHPLDKPFGAFWAIYTAPRSDHE